MIEITGIEWLEGDYLPSHMGMDGCFHIRWNRWPVWIPHTADERAPWSGALSDPSRTVAQILNALPSGHFQLAFWWRRNPEKGAVRLAVMAWRAELVGSLNPRNLRTPTWFEPGAAPIVTVLEVMLS